MDLRLTDVDIGDDEIEDLVIADVGCIIWLKTNFSLGSKIYDPKNILSKSPAPCGFCRRFYCCEMDSNKVNATSQEKLHLGTLAQAILSFFWQ